MDFIKRIRILMLAVVVLPSPDRSALETPAESVAIDQKHFAEWMDGKEKAVTLKEECIVWTSPNSCPLFWPPLSYGLSKTPAVRYVRVPFKQMISLGSILARGGGQLSILKPTATYPGNLNDESEWIPATRVENGKIESAEARDQVVALWVLPSVVFTRALRFKHEAQASDPNYAGWLGEVYVLSERYVNVAQLGFATSHFPEWGFLRWPKKIEIIGLGLISLGFEAAEAQILGENGEWQTINTVAGMKGRYPAQWNDFGKSVTKAVRLRNAGWPKENEGHPDVAQRRRLIQPDLPAPADLRTPAGYGERGIRGAVGVKFFVPENGFVTLVIEDSEGKRVRNLVADTFFRKGPEVVYWDGTDDLGRNVDAAAHGVYSIPARLVQPGKYTLRGLWHKQINLRYEMPVYSAGNPPWETQDGRGGWTTNHTPPSSALFVPAQSAVYLGSHVGEGGAALAWVDLEGHKLGGRRWVGGNWTGAQYLALDGARVYAGSSFDGEVRLTEITAGGEKKVLKFPSKGMAGLAARNGVLVLSEPSMNQLVFVDVGIGKIVKTMPVEKPGGIAFDREGRLLILSGKKLLREGMELGEFEEPVGITVDGSGQIYVSDRGKSHQVKKLSADGKVVQVFGDAGEPRAGFYNERHMNNPAGIAVDSNGRLLVTEQDFQPKRVSVWNADGSLWKAFYGPAQYGGGGALDSHDASRFSYNGMEFKLDWKTGQEKLTRVFWRPTDSKIPPPETALYFNGRRYMTNAFNINPTQGQNEVTLFLDNGETVTPVVTKKAAGGVTVGPDGSFYFAREGLRFRPVKFTLDGVPIYESKGEVIVKDPQGPASSGGDQILPGTEGWTFFSTAPKPFSSAGFGGVKNGVPMWTYPSLWPGLHPSHSSPAPDRRGEIVGSTRMLGEPVMPKGSKVGPLFFVNGNQGNIYVMTQDGLFVSQLFQDVRQGKLWQMPSAQPGMSLNELTLHDENFFPTVTQVPDGSIHLMAGATPALVKVEGLESLRAIPPMRFELTQKQVEMCRDFVRVREAERQSKQGAEVMLIGKSPHELTLANQLHDWAGAQWVPIDKRGVAAYFDSHSRPYDVEAAAAVVKDKLCVVWKTGDGQLLRNSGEPEEMLFKTGGALDLMVSPGPTKAVRLVVTKVNGRTKAMLFPRAADVSREIDLTADGQGNYEVVVPLALLGLEVGREGGVKGDVGILRGDRGQTVERVYWHNKATAIVSDVESEARLTPELWGVWRFGN